MYKFMQKNKKKMLAVFGVLLMIVFVLPTVMFDRHHGSTKEVIAKIANDEPITLGEVRQAQNDWRHIEQSLLVSENDPVVVLARDLRDNPELFVLLQREARQMGLRVSDAQVTENLTQLARFMAFNGRQLPNPGELKPAMRSLLLMRALLERVAGSVKASGPLALHQMAESFQRVKLDLTHYAGEDFAKTVAAPTPEQLQKQFDDFKNTPPGFPDARNPFGAGYLVPAKVKLAYFTIPRAEAAAAVQKSKEQIDWETQAVLYYRSNQTKYPTTQPLPELAKTQPTTTQPAGPTTKPFAEVKQQVMEEVMRPDIERKVDEVAAALHERLVADFDAVQKKSASAPKDFGRKEYADRIVADIEKRHGVRLGLAEINDPKDEAGLKAIPGIGLSFTGDTVFAEYVIRWAEPLVPAAQKNAAEVLSVDEPSPRLRDLAGNVYVFQLREAAKAHAPANLDEVRAKVEADVRAKLAFDAAVAEAKKLRDAAAKTGLESAAKAAGKDIFPTPDFLDRRSAAFSTTPLLPKVELPDAARQQLIAEAFKLLSSATPEQPHPVAVIELPAAGRVVVAELSEVERMWQDEEQDEFQYTVARQLAGQRAQQVVTDYFKFDAVKQRLGYDNPRERKQS